jgi:hypothetical protein
MTPNRGSVNDGWRSYDRCWLGVLLALAWLTPAEAQERLAPCTEACGVELARVATLGAPAGPGYVGRPKDLVQRSDGIFVLVDRADQDEVKFYAADGRYLRSFGRRGNGPGEFSTINLIALLPGDSVQA